MYVVSAFRRTTHGPAKAGHYVHPRVLLAEAMGRRDVGGAEPPIVQRGGDERAVTAGIGKPGEVLISPHATAGQEHLSRRRLTHAGDQREVEPGARADARQVENDHGADAGICSSRGHHVCRLAEGTIAARRDDRLAVAQVKAEGDAAAVHCCADLAERLVRRERLEPDDDACGTEIQRVARALGGRHAGVEPQGNTERCHEARKAPPIPAKAAPIANAWSLATVVLIPMARAASSSSRIACQAQPIRESRRRAEAARTRRRATRNR